MFKLKSDLRVVDSSGDLIKSVITPRGIQIFYRSDNRELLVLNKMSRSVNVDGKYYDFKALEGLHGWSVALPSGQHKATIVSRGSMEYILVVASLLVSNMIILISALSIAGLIFIYLIVRRKTVRHKK